MRVHLGWIVAARERRDSLRLTCVHWRAGHDVQNGAAHSHVQSDRQRLLIVLVATSIYFVAELTSGYFAGSLALLSDAVHMLTDIAALCLALLTLWISTRPASSGKTYGYLRAEILGAMANGLFLWLLVIFIWVKAVERLRNPEPVAGLTVIAIASIGLVVNSFSAWMTYAIGSAEEGRPGMAVRAVFIH